MAKNNKKQVEFNGGSKRGEAARLIGIKLTQQTVRDKTKYRRKVKHKKLSW